MKPFWNSSIILGFFLVHWVNFGRVEPGPLENIYSHIVILLISFRMSCDVIFGVWKVWLIWWHQSFALKLMESISPENLRNRTSTVFAERAFATWTWSGNRLRAKCCLRHGLLQSLWGRFLYSLYIVFGRDPASFIPTISIIVLPSTVAFSKKREICLNLHALIWLSHGPLICCPRWWFQCLMFSVSYNTS